MAVWGGGLLFSPTPLPGGEERSGSLLSGHPGPTQALVRSLLGGLPSPPSPWPIAPPSCPLLALLPTAVTLMSQDSNLTPSDPAEQPAVAPYVPGGRFRLGLVASGLISHLHASWVPPLLAVHHQPEMSHPNPQETPPLPLPNLPDPVQRPPLPGSLPLLPGLESYACVYVLSLALPSTRPGIP